MDSRTMNDKRMIIKTGTNEIHLEFTSIQEKREWLLAIDQAQRTIHFGYSAIDNSTQQSIKPISPIQDLKSSSKQGEGGKMMSLDQSPSMQREISQALSIALN